MEFDENRQSKINEEDIVSGESEEEGDTVGELHTNE